MMVRSPKKSRFVLTFFPMVLLIAPMAVSQTSGLPQADRQIRSQENKRKDFRLPTRNMLFDEEQKDFLGERQAQFNLDLQSQPLETPIDPESYHVGPGDQFLITIWSSLENSIPAKVTPAGKLLIPTVGAIDIQGLNLSEAQQLIRTEVSKKYLNSEISADLVMVRAIRIHVTGQVLNPGTYSVLAVHRVADAIELAGGLTSWAYERDIQVRHPDGTAHSIDLDRFKYFGDITKNIYLRGGDVVYVPSIDLNHATVRIEGAINDPGIYELSEQETLNDFLLRTEALSRRADLRGAYIVRDSSGNGQSEVIPVFKYLENTNSHTTLILQDGDVINVPQRQEDVYVIGAVRNPGGYPYIPGFNAYDYIGLAGSTENAGNPDRTKIYRQFGDQKKKIDDIVVQAGDVVFVPRRVEFGPREVLAVITTVTNILLTMKALNVL